MQVTALEGEECLPAISVDLSSISRANYCENQNLVIVSWNGRRTTRHAPNAASAPAEARCLGPRVGKASRTAAGGRNAAGDIEHVIFAQNAIFRSSGGHRQAVGRPRCRGRIVRPEKSPQTLEKVQNRLAAHERARGPRRGSPPASRVAPPVTPNQWLRREGLG